jgi:protein-disulfide isomerase
VEPQLVNDYVATGKVLFEFKDLAFLGDESIQAAQAADCALDQGKFWPYHDTLYANQHGENQGSFTTERLKAIAQTVGLNMSMFDHCLESDVLTMKGEASNAGIHQSPTLVVNGTVITYQGYGSLKAAIDADLKKG